MAFCIPKIINRKLKEAINRGDINVNELMKKSSDELSSYIEKYVGKDYSTEIANRFTRNFGTELSEDEIGYIMKAFTKIDDLKKTEGFNPNGSTEWSRMYAKLDNYMEDVVNPSNKLTVSEQIKQGLKSEIQKIKDQEDTLSKIIQGGKSGFNILTSPIYKSVKASLDASFALRQGFKIFTKSPKTWYDNIGKAYEVFKNVKSKEAMNAIKTEFKARMLAHPNYQKLVNEGKLAVNVIEDFFPTTVTEKVPRLGNLFKASNDSFSMFSQGARFDIANDLLEKATKIQGRELNKEELKAIGQLANSITGRGSLGKSEAMSGALNKLFFSARYIRSQADTFIMPFNQQLTPFARQEALKHSLTTFGAIGSLIATASMFGDVELDPRSSRFGKLKINDKNYIDLTAGLGSYITLAARQATGETKSGNKITKLNTGEFGGKTRADVVFDWLTGKLAPAPGTLYNVFGKGKMFGGEEPTPVNIARNLVAPITADNAYDYFKDEDKATALILTISDLLGAGVSQYK